MSYYYEDVRDALRTEDGAGFAPGTHGPLDEASPSGFQRGPNISRQDAESLLGEVWDDSTARHRVLGAAAIYAEGNLQDDLAQYPADEAQDEVMKLYGRDVGMLTGAAYDGPIAEAEQAEALQDAGKALFAVGGAAAGGAGPGAAAVAAGLDSVASGAVDNATDGPDELEDQRDHELADARLAARAGTAELLIRNGQWPASEMPPDHLFHDGHFDINTVDDANDLQRWIDGVASHNIVHAHDSFSSGLETGMARYK